MSNALYATIIADTLAQVEDCVTDLTRRPSAIASEWCVAVDLEGVQLSRKGRVSLVQLKASHSLTVWLLDITILGQSAFDHANEQGTTIRHILESTVIRKLFYDVRRDADALYNIYGVDMKNVTDVQIVELAVRKLNLQPISLLNGLSRSIPCYLSPPWDWLEVKERGVSLFSPEKGGSYEVFEQRPLDPALIAYSAQDVVLLSALEARLLQLMGRFKSNWTRRIRAASDRRLAEARSPFFSEDGPHRAFSPLI